MCEQIKIYKLKNELKFKGSNKKIKCKTRQCFPHIWRVFTFEMQRQPTSQDVMDRSNKISSYALIECRSGQSISLRCQGSWLHM